jgi:hypothetical protein
VPTKNKLKAALILLSKGFTFDKETLCYFTKPLKKPPCVY